MCFWNVTNFILGILVFPPAENMNVRVINVASLQIMQMNRYSSKMEQWSVVRFEQKINEKNFYS